MVQEAKRYLSIKEHVDPLLQYGIARSFVGTYFEMGAQSTAASDSPKGSWDDALIRLVATPGRVQVSALGKTWNASLLMPLVALHQDRTQGFTPALHVGLYVSPSPIIEVYTA